MTVLSLPVALSASGHGGASGSSGSAVPTRAPILGTEWTQVLQLNKNPLPNSAAQRRNPSLLAFQHYLPLCISVWLQESFLGWRCSAGGTSMEGTSRWRAAAATEEARGALVIQVCLRFPVLKQLMSNKLIYMVRWDPAKQFWCKMTYLCISVVLGS